MKKFLVPVSAVNYTPTGLTGATAASRYAGATASGAPASGTFVTGDWVVAQNGHIFICTAGGTPGTWVDAGGSGAVTSVAGRTGVVTLTAADIGAGTFPAGSFAFTGLITANAGIAVPAGQSLTTGTRSVVTGTRSTTTNATDTVNLGTFATTAGTMELRMHLHLVTAGASITKVYEMALSNAMGTTSTWYLVYPSDASANAAATNDFALEVQRTSGTTYNYRIRQKSIAAAGVITFTVEALGDTAVTFTPSTTVTAAPAAVTTMHPANPHVEAAGQVGIGTEAPAALLDVAGTARAVYYAAAGTTGATAASRYGGATASGAPTTGTWLTGDFVVAQNGHIFICTAGGTPGTWADAGSAGSVSSVAGRSGAVTLTAADIGGGTFPGSYGISGTLTMANTNGLYWNMASGNQSYIVGNGTNLLLRGGTTGIAVRNTADTVTTLNIDDSGAVFSTGSIIAPNHDATVGRRALDVYNARASVGGTATTVTPTGWTPPVLTVQPTSVTDAAMILLRGAAGQTGEHLQLQDPNGAVFLSANQAPADILRLTDVSGGVSKFTQRGSLLATGGLQAMGTVAQQGNLFTANQASIETDTTGWFVGVNSTLTRSTAQAVSGAASLAVTAVANGDMSAGAWTGAGKTTPGQVYTFVVSARAGSISRAVSARIDWNLAGAYVSSTLSVYIGDPTASWGQLSLSAMAPPGTDGATVVVTILGPAAGEVHYFDCLAIYPNPTANLLDDSDFDNTYGLENWGVGGGTIAVSNDVAWTGLQSMKIATIGTGTTSVNSGGVLLGAGVTVTFSARVYLATAYGLGVVYMDMTGAGSLDSANSNADLSKTNQWQYITGTVTTTTAGAHYVRLISGDNGHPIAGTIYLDAVKLEVGATATPYVPPTYSNLIVNPSFEIDATGWSPVSTQTLSVTSIWSAVGGKSLVVTSGGTTIDCYAVQTVYTTAPTVTVSATAYLPNPMSGSLDTRARTITCYTFNAAGSLIGGYSSNAIPNTAKATGRLSVTVPVPAGGRLEVRLYNGSTTLGDTVYWDAVQCDLGNAVNPYIDGSMGPGYSWDASNNILSAQNASFESAGVGGWLAGANWTIANSTAQAFDGTHSLLCTRSNTTAGNGYASLGSFSCAPQTTYTYSVWVRASAATQYTIRASGNVTSSMGQVIFTGVVNTWVRIATTFTTGNDTSISLLVTDDGNVAPTSGSTLYIDAVQLEQRNYASPWLFSASPTASNATSTYQAPWYVGSSGAGARVELGRSDGVASVPRLDFRPSGLGEFDVRLQASTLGAGPGQGQLDLLGKLVVNTPGFNNATGLEIVANSVLTGRGPELQLYDTNPAYGSTGSKFMRVNSGALQFVNSGYGSVIWTLDDSGQTHAVDTLHMAHATHGLISVAYAGAGEDNDSYGIVGVTAPAGANRAYYSMTAAGNSVYGMGMGTDNLLRLGAISTGKVMGANVVKIDGSANITTPGNVSDGSGRVYSPGNPPPGPSGGVIGQSDSLIIKSGAVSTNSSSVSFTTAFPTACTAVVMSAPQAGTIPIIVNVTGYNASGFSFVARTNSNTTPGTLTLAWIAVGY